MKHVTFILLLAALIMPLDINAQNQKGQETEPMEKSQKNKLIDQLIKQLNAIYIFPEIAKQVEDKIGQYKKQGVYDNIEDPELLARTLTDHLREISRDKHLAVWYRPAPKRMVMDADAQKARELAMKRFHSRGNMGFPEIDILEGNVGYLKVIGFGPVEYVANTCSGAMNYLANTDALILDLRENHGGEPDMVRYLASYFFDKQPVHINDIYYRDGNRMDEFWTLEDIPGQRYINKPVYVLISNETFSGGEELAYDLQTQKRAILIGETTGGGANPGIMVDLGKGFVAHISNGRAVNPITKTNWEGTGVLPDIALNREQALQKAHVLALEELMRLTPDEGGKKYYRDSLENIQK